MNVVANSIVRPARVRAVGSDGIVQVLVVLVIGCLLALGVFATESYVIARQQAATAAAAPAVAEIYTGSILYMPNEGRICHQLLFDNHTGHLIDNGYVDCGQAAYHGASDPPVQWSAARARVISAGFRQH